ncbi:MAG TPA: CPBP family intramembrane glutamic endopeptidase [Xanthobacteraceae bacterium]
MMTADTAPESSAPDSRPPRGAPWLFWGTTLWAIAILLTAGLVLMVCSLAGLLWLHADPRLSHEELNAILYSHWRLFAAILAAAAASGLAVLSLAVRLSRLGAREYLGLILPRGVDVKIGLAGLALLYASFALATHLIGQPREPSPFAGQYQSSSSFGALAAMALELVVLAPASEELFFRGFLLRGWSVARLGPAGAIVLTAAIWTASHGQYAPIALAYLFCVGLLLGWLRQRSGSTLLTIFLHAINNAAGLSAIAFYDRLA